MAAFFVMFSTDPDVDPRKCVVGLACATQAIEDGHQGGYRENRAN